MTDMRVGFNESEALSWRIALVQAALKKRGRAFGKLPIMHHKWAEGCRFRSWPAQHTSNDEGVVEYHRDISEVES